MIVFDTNISFQGATTQYIGFNYNSLVKFENSFFAASENGLYKIDGTTIMFPETLTREEDFESYFEIGTIDFGVSQQKRLRAIYVGYEADGDITIKISTELSSEESYVLPASINNQYAKKTTINRSLKGRYWTFQVYSNNNVKFAIDEIKILPIIRSHGFDQN